MSDPVKSPVKPTLDDLFAVKRAERPDDAFWNQFERGLRQKQLAAIVLPRPWWHAPSLWARKAAPYGGFAAAAAALALAFTTLRSPVAEQTLSIPPSPAPVAQVVLVPSDQGLTPPRQTLAPSLAVVATVSPEAAPAVQDLLPDLGLAANLAAAENPVLSTPVAAVPDSSAPVVALAQVVVMPRLGELGFVAEPVLVDTSPPLLSSSLDEVPLTAPLADEMVILPPAVLNSRHDRLLARALEEAPGEEDRSLAQVRDRVVHRLADGDELYASITRVGVSGDRLSLKF